MIHNIIYTCVSSQRFKGKKGNQHQTEDEEQSSLCWRSLHNWSQKHMMWLPHVVPAYSPAGEQLKIINGWWWISRHGLVARSHVARERNREGIFSRLFNAESSTVRKSYKHNSWFNVDSIFYETCIESYVLIFWYIYIYLIFHIDNLYNALRQPWQPVFSTFTSWRIWFDSMKQRHRAAGVSSK